MITKSNINVAETLRIFKRHGLNVAFLVPTQTGMGKSIMDATRQVRLFLKAGGIHDFVTQDQGENNKKLVKTLYIHGTQPVETTASLYRPKAKVGDPRIWIYALKTMCGVEDLLGLIVLDKKLVIINCSACDLDYCLSTTLRIYFNKATLKTSTDEVASELLEKLREISNRGMIPTMLSGDSGIGYTLEKLLGIKANSSQMPDYKGIEIKSIRKNANQAGKSTIFAKVPNWKISNRQSSREILEARGKYNKKKTRLQLFHEINALAANSYNLKLVVQHDKQVIQQTYEDNTVSEVDVEWEFATLEKQLKKKHKNTFWVAAQTEGKSGEDGEKFHYSSVKYTSELDAVNFPILIELGVVTISYLIHKTPKGGTSDRGYLFKIASKDLELLFASIKEYDLTIPLEV